MQGPDGDDPICAGCPSELTLPSLDKGIAGLRIARAGGYFDGGLFPEAKEALARVAEALSIHRTIELPEARRARAAAYVITATEGASLHLDRLRERACDFDPAVRDRLLAGAMVPAALVVKAQQFRRWYRDRVLALFNEVDAILAPRKAVTGSTARLPPRCRIGGPSMPTLRFINGSVGSKGCMACRASSCWMPLRRAEMRRRSSGCSAPI